MSDNNKQYLLFAGDKYYPEGGGLDYKMTGTQVECKDYFFEKNKKPTKYRPYRYDWAQIVDPETMSIILFGKCSLKGDNEFRITSIDWCDDPL